MHIEAGSEMALPFCLHQVGGWGEVLKLAPLKWLQMLGSVSPRASFVFRFLRVRDRQDDFFCYDLLYESHRQKDTILARFHVVVCPAGELTAVELR